MGILVNFALVKFFRPVEHRAQSPECLCGTRIIVVISAQKERRKKSKFKCAKNQSLTHGPLVVGLSPHYL